MKLVVCIFILVFSTLANASGTWTRATVARFHARFDTNPERARRIHRQATQTIKLPISPGYDQRRSGLCWFYATSSAIESNFLVSHPNVKIALSRSAMQYINMEDRYQRKFYGNEDYISEGGTAVDAFLLLRSKKLRNTGLFAWGDFHPFPADVPTDDPLGKIGPDQLYEALEKTYGLPPALTHDVLGREMTPYEFQNTLLANQQWVAYSRADTNHPEGVGQHFDPDARKGTLATYLKPEIFNKILRVALVAKHALVVTWSGHDEEIFGADFDDGGMPLQVFIKGSYGPNYIHIMSATDAYKLMHGMATLVLK